MEVFIVQIKHSIGAVAACAAVIATLISASPAQATTKGISGLIAMQSTRGGGTQDFSMNSDGTNQVNVTNDPGKDEAPAWSPDGAQILWDSDRSGKLQVYIMKSDGSIVSDLTNTTSNETEPDFSPDGTKITFESDRTGNH